MSANTTIEQEPLPAPAGSEFIGEQTVHMCVDIAGVMRWPDSQLRELFKEDDGSKRPGAYVRDWLKLQLAQGKQVLPMGKPCEGFSYIHGCPGHPIRKTQNS